MRRLSLNTTLVMFQIVFHFWLILPTGIQATTINIPNNENTIDSSSSQLVNNKHKAGANKADQAPNRYLTGENKLRTESNSLFRNGSVSRVLKSKHSKQRKKYDSSNSESSKSSKSGSKSSKSSNDSGDSSMQNTEAEAVRAALKTYVDSLNEGLEMDRGYHRSAADQDVTYNTCTIVQQCLDPDFILSLGRMSSRSRGLAYTSVSKAMSQESFNMLQLQQSSNMLLGEMQDWGTVCDGTCRELRDPNGLLERIVDVPLEGQSDPIPFMTYAQCGQLSSTKKTFWLCNDDPKMVHQANIDMATGKYYLGNIWNEPHIHGRNLWYDYFAAYGDMEEGGGAFGMRFSGHHIDLNYQWDNDGCLINDMPVFLGHNPLIVPDVTPPKTRAHNERLELHDFHPLLWENFAGVSQFQLSIELMLDVTNLLLETAPESYVPLYNWESNGYYGALDLAEDKSLTDFTYVDLSCVTDSEFQTYWDLIEYTIRFARGHRSTEVERSMFREEGKVIWTTSEYPDHIPLTEYDLRSGMNFIDVRIETNEWIYFVLSNQMYAVISEDMPSNHMHSIIVPKALINADHACVDESSTQPGGICYSEKVEIVEDDELLSGTYKYESLMWSERNLKGRSILDLEAFEEALEFASEFNCGLGFSATLFDENANLIYHKDVGTYYNPMPDGNTFDDGGYGDKTVGWTGDTIMTPYSNIKGVAASVYLAAVVDTNLGYLDEPIYLTLDYLSENESVGKITPRMILSHTSGLNVEDRSNPLTSSYYVCIYDETTTLGDCLQKYLLLDSNLVHPPGFLQAYNNEAFDILAELAVRKTGIESFGEIFRRYITEPLGMHDTTYDCPFMRSTNEKPHVAWGTCSTGNNFAKWVQMISNDGMAPDGSGKQILSKYAITQMFSHGGGNAANDGDWIFGGASTVFMTRCYGRYYDNSDFGTEDTPGSPDTYPLNSPVGYGLGTMFLLGNHGHMFGHAGSTGGFWFVSPGRYSGYIAWMGSSTKSEEFGNSYFSAGDVVISLEEASKFEVSKSNVKEAWEEIELCGGHDVYLDYFEKIGISSISEMVPQLCYATAYGEQRSVTEVAVDPRIESHLKSIARRNLIL